MIEALAPARLAALLLAGLLIANHASAHLGGDEASIMTDAQALGAMAVRVPGVGFNRFDIKLARGAVHEYSTPSGQVFAITFSGGARPALGPLLGDYLDAFTAGLAHQSGNHRSAGVDTSTLKATLSGPPNAVSGRIWLPTQVPAQVSIESLP